MPTHYEVVGVPKSASADEIKRAFHSAARKFHPDKQTGNPLVVSPFDDAQFLRLQAAWETLRDKERRHTYDATLSLQESRHMAKCSSAIPLSRNDCEMEWVYDDDVTENKVQAWVTTCRCGELLEFIPSEWNTLSLAAPLLSECPGCSLVYDWAKLRLGETSKRNCE
jgi:diphthamide biosynthesis protein 4